MDRKVAFRRSVWALYSSKRAQTTRDSSQGVSISYCSKSSVYCCYSLLTLSFRNPFSITTFRVLYRHMWEDAFNCCFCFVLYIYFLFMHSFLPPRVAATSPLPLATPSACQKTPLAPWLWWARRDDLGEDHKCNHVSFTPVWWWRAWVHAHMPPRCKETSQDEGNQTQCTEHEYYKPLYKKYQEK